jgi:hypothetical protein
VAVRLGELSPAHHLGPLVRSAVLYAAEMAFFLTLFGLYFVLRGLPTDRIPESTANAVRIIELERSLGVFWEVGWQQAARDHSLLIEVANFTYKYLHLPLLLVAGFLFFHSDRRKYRVLRNAILLSGFIGVFFYFLFPVTPPRLLAAAGHDIGFVDTLEGARRIKPGPLTNDYAAVPSYHFGWIALFVVGVWWCWRSWLLRAGAVAFAGLMWWAIVVTGNHYFFDMVMGALLVAAALLLSYSWESWAGRSRSPVRRWTLHVHGHRVPF